MSPLLIDSRSITAVPGVASSITTSAVLSWVLAWLFNATILVVVWMGLVSKAHATDTQDQTQPLQEVQHYTIHTGPNGYPPFVIVGGNIGDPVYSGIVVDFLDAFENSDQRFKRRYVLLSRKRANALMAQGTTYDLMFQSPLFVNQNVLKHFKFTRSFLTSKDVLVTSSGSDLVYTEPESLYSKQIGIIRGYGYGEFDSLFDQNLITGLRVDSHRQAIGMVAEGRVDGYVGNIHVSPYYIKLAGKSRDEFQFSEQSMYEFDLAFLVNRRNHELYEALDAFINLSIEDGSLAAIVESYLR